MFVTGLKEIMPHYDGYLIDLWGVVHDGVQPYPGAVACLQELQNQGKTVILLSNGPRRAHVAVDRLAQLGVTPNLYAQVCTSGEQTHQLLAQMAQESPGRSFFHIGTERDVSLYEGLNLTKVEQVAEADFILCSDTFTWDQKVEDLDVQLTEALARTLPLICANPDRVVFTQGGLKLCAGSFAHRYEQMGGAITLIGKPHPQVYDYALGYMPGIPRERILAIGDSLRTDIQGGLNQGIDGVLMAGGIHMPELGNVWGEVPDETALTALFETYGITPRYVMGSLKV
jgi:HAD superfamily hydrolase (TIGR01459 family)